MNKKNPTVMDDVNIAKFIDKTIIIYSEILLSLQEKRSGA